MKTNQMIRRASVTLLMLSAILIMAGCDGGRSPRMIAVAAPGNLVGAWRSKIAFRSGPLAEMKDLEFLYAYNAGGTMTESSNYDEASNSSPPAYGIWKQLTPQTFETRYEFYTTRAQVPASVPPNSDWWPAGHGVLTETITLSPDGQTYTSTIKLATYDLTGAPVPGVGEGTGAGTRIVF